MFNEAKGYSGKHRYEIHPTKTNVVVAANEHKVKDNPSWTLGENLIQTTDSAVHLGISRSGKKESNINTTERISVARRTKCNAKSCNCCQHLCTNTTITSSVNGRTFSVINNSDLD